jgi:hypothetical protein
VRSPMVFIGRAFYERQQPELVEAVRRQANRFGWSELLTVLDDVDAVVEFVQRHDPDDTASTVARRRRRPGTP